MLGPASQALDVSRLEDYLVRNVTEIKTPISIQKFSHGQSNPTYLLRDSSGTKYVLRKKPAGPLISPSAHRIEREYRVLHALGTYTDLPVPRVIWLCENTTVLGSAFYIMEFIQGRIFEDATIPHVSPEERGAMWHSAIATLAALHRVDPESIGLEGFGKPTQFYVRQMATLTKLSSKQAGVINSHKQEVRGEIPHFDDLVKAFGDKGAQPEDRSALVHGDFKIDNLIFHPLEPRIIGILDWELSTTGHPLADLANLIMPWNTGDWGREQAHNMPHDSRLGLPSRWQCIQWYASLSQHPVTDDEVIWAEAFNVFRAAVIAQGITARFVTGQASSAVAERKGAEMLPLGNTACNMIQGLFRTSTRNMLKL